MWFSILSFPHMNYVYFFKGVATEFPSSQLHFYRVGDSGGHPPVWSYSRIFLPVPITMIHYGGDTGRFLYMPQLRSEDTGICKTALILFP